MAKNQSMNPSDPTAADPNAQPATGGDGPMQHSYTGDGGQAAATQGQSTTAPGAKMGNPQVQPQTGPQPGSYQVRVLKNVAIGGSKDNPNGRKVAIGEITFVSEAEMAEAPTAFELVDSNQSVRST